MLAAYRYTCLKYLLFGVQLHFFNLNVILPVYMYFAKVQKECVFERVLCAGSCGLHKIPQFCLASVLVQGIDPHM